MIPREDKIAGKAVANRKIPEPDSGYLAFPSGFGIEPVRACRIHNRELRGLARFLVQELELLCEGQQQRWRLMRYFPLNFIGVALCLYSVLTVSWQLAVLIVVILAAANSAMSRLQPEPPLEKLMRIEDSELEPYRDEIRDLCFRMLSSERKRKGSALGRLDLGNADESATSVKVLDKILRQAEFGEGENGLASAGGTGPRRLDIVAKLTALQMLSSLLHEDEVDSSVAHEADLLSH